MICLDQDALNQTIETMEKEAVLKTDHFNKIQFLFT
mgnify:CR=1 FL=1